MKWITSVEQMREADAYTIRELKVPGVLLMEAAADAVADRLCELADPNTDSILFLCGSGNNGGDGFAAARMMKMRGYQVRVFCTSSPQNLEGDAKINYDMLSGYQISVLTMEQSSAFTHIVEQSEWVVDAMLGTGLDRTVEGFYRQVITSINEMHQQGRFKVLSIDIPSGISGDTGKILGCAIEADETVTFCRLKPGLLLFPGRDCAGNVTVAEIGIPDSVPSLEQSHQFQLEYTDLPRILPKRKSRSHKGLYGHLLLLSGCSHMTGAAVLSCQSAYKVGSGLVEAIMPESVTSVLMSYVPEAITTPYKDSEEESFDFLKERIKTASCVVAGPGLSKAPYVRRMLTVLFENIPANTPMVLDADALNALSEFDELRELIKKRGQNTVLTPHLGEAARLLKCSVKEIMEDPLKAANEITEKYRTVTVLKDAMTIVTEPGGRIFYNSTGNNGMSTAGSGDVLSGMIGGLLGQGMDVFSAAYTGVFLHGAAGDLAKREVGTYGMRASDIINHIHLEQIMEKEKEQ